MGEGESEMGNCTVTIGTLVGGSHTREACFDHPLSLPQKEWGLKKSFKGNLHLKSRPVPVEKLMKNHLLTQLKLRGTHNSKGLMNRELTRLASCQLVKSDTFLINKPFLYMSKTI